MNNSETVQDSQNSPASGPLGQHEIRDTKNINLRNTIAATLARQIFVLIINLVSISVVSRTLGAEEYGQYVLALLAVQLTFTIFSLSVPATIIFYTEQYRAANKLANLFGAAIILELAGTLLLAFILGIAWQLGLLTIYPMLVGHLNLLGILFLAQMGNATLESFLIGMRNYRWFNTMQLIIPVLFLLGILFLLDPDSSWNHVILINVFVTLAALPIYIAIVWYMGLPWPRFTISPLKQILVYGRYLWFANLVGVANVRVQYLLFESILGLNALGKYALTNQFAEKLWIPGQATAIIVFPERAARISEKSTLIRFQGLKYAFANMCLVFIGTIILYYFMAWFGATVFGNEFRELHPIVMALAPGIIAWSGVKIFAAELAGAGHSIDNGLISLTSLCVGILGIWFGSRHGIVGAAFGVSGGYSAGFVLALALFWRRTRSNEQ